MAWYPNADRSTVGNNAGAYTGGPYKGVLHTTEGSSAAGAIGAFKANNSWPHFLVDNTGKVWQFIDTTKAGRALQNLAGGIQTNTDSAIQIEVTGFASQPLQHPLAQMDGLKALMRWIEVNTGVKPKGPGRAFATAYGQNSLRFTFAQWDAFDGWCGHCHVPENDHWDPGAINLDALLPAPGFSVPASYFTEAFMPFSLPRTQGGYLVVGGDGGVFTYDGAPFFGSLPGVGVTAQVAGAAWTPSGNGYWILGNDGAIFAFGDAPFHGGLNGTPHLGNRKLIGLVAKGNGYKMIALDPNNDGSPFDSYDFGV